MNIINRIKNLIHRRMNMVSFCRGKGMSVGRNCIISHTVNIGTEPYLISIGDHCELTFNVQLITHDGGVWVFREKHPDWDLIGPIKIGNNVYIGVCSIIMPNVTIGDNCVIGAGAIVTRDIPENSVAVGAPARVIKTIDEYYFKAKNSVISTKELVGAEKQQRVKDLLRYS